MLTYAASTICNCLQLAGSHSPLACHCSSVEPWLGEDCSSTSCGVGAIMKWAMDASCFQEAASELARSTGCCLYVVVCATFLQSVCQTASLCAVAQAHMLCSYLICSPPSSQPPPDVWVYETPMCTMVYSVWCTLALSPWHLRNKHRNHA